MGTPEVPAALQNPEALAASYKQVYDDLKAAYWNAADDASRNLISDVLEKIAEIITVLDQMEIAALTEQYLALKPKIDGANARLQELQRQAHQIITDMAIAGKVIAGITKLLSMF